MAVAAFSPQDIDRFRREYRSNPVGAKQAGKFLKAMRDEATGAWNEGHGYYEVSRNFDITNSPPAVFNWRAWIAKRLHATTTVVGPGIERVMVCFFNEFDANHNQARFDYVIFRTDGIAHRLHPHASGGEDLILRRMENEWLQVVKAEEGEDADNVDLAPATHRRITLGKAAANFTGRRWDPNSAWEPECGPDGVLNLPVRVPDGSDGGAPGPADNTGSPVVQETAASQPPPPRRPGSLIFSFPLFPPLPDRPMPLNLDEAVRELNLLRQRVRDLEHLREQLRDEEHMFEHMFAPNTEPAPESSLRPPGGAPELAADPPPTQPATTAPPGGAQGPAAHRQPPMGEVNSYNTAPEGGAQGPAVNSSQPPITTAPPGQWQQPHSGQPTWQPNRGRWHNWRDVGAGWSD